MQSGVIEGIVLRKIDYSESSIILKVLTENDGIQSFLFPGGKSKKKNGNIIAPLSILTLEYYSHKESDLGKIRSLDSAIVYKNIPYDPYKSSIIFFMNEVLNNSLKEKEDNRDLFRFLKQILQILDLSDHVANFPIKFLYQLTKYLGFYPQLSDNPIFFDLQEGTYLSHIPNHPFYLSKENSALLLSFSNANFDGVNDPGITLEKRRDLIHDLIKYYEVIFDNFKTIKSLSVLESTFHD